MGGPPVFLGQIASLDVDPGSVKDARFSGCTLSTQRPPSFSSTYRCYELGLRGLVTPSIQAFTFGDCG